MVSVVVVGPPMSGKTSLCSALAGLNNRGVSMQQTHSCWYTEIDINQTPYHIWDTPAIADAEDINSGWAGEDALKEANVVVVCHDGRHVSPMPLVNACGPDRCIIALTRSLNACVDVSYCIEYLSTVCSDGSLVPRTYGRDMLLICLWHKACSC